MQRELNSEKKQRTAGECKAAKELKAAKQKSYGNQNDREELAIIISEMQQRINEYEDIINKRDDVTVGTQACSVCYEEINTDRKPVFRTRMVGYRNVVKSTKDKVPALYSPNEANQHASKIFCGSVEVF